MKKQQKYLPYLLAPLLIVIWGMVFKQVRDQTSPNAYQPDFTWSGPEAESEPFSFQLSLDYEDPFLKGQRQNVPVAPPINPGPSRRPTPKPAKVPVAVPFPVCQFIGTIQSEGGQAKAMIRSNGQLYQLAAGQEFMQWRIVRFDTDSLLLTLGKEKHWLKR